MFGVVQTGLNTMQSTLNKEEIHMVPARSVKLRIGDLVSPTRRALQQLPHMTDRLGLISQVVGINRINQIVYVWWFNTHDQKLVPINTLWLQVNRDD